jgi:glucose/arabinose dehydrogenase
MSERHRDSAVYACVSPYCHWLRLLLTIWCVSFLAVGKAEAARVPSGFVDSQIAGGLSSPSAMTATPDGRLLVVQQGGEIRIIKGDALLSTPFYIAGNVDSFAERGCLGITTGPDFASNGFVYIYCTVTDGINSHNRIFRVTAVNDVALPGSEQTILDLPDVPAGTKWHMGGALHFGADGKLYAAVGSQEDMRPPGQTGNSQNLANPFGKILRINADGTVPNDNPFVNIPGVYEAIFALGLRNPFSFDIQSGSGLMYINDVGAGSFEEINKGMAGANYGWPLAEGDTSDARFVNPAYLYSHSEGCAITGGTFYDPLALQFPAAYVGMYFFVDLCSGWIRVLDPSNPVRPAEFATAISNPVGLAVAPDGSLYYLARNMNGETPTGGAGTVGKITFQ